VTVLHEEVEGFLILSVEALAGSKQISYMNVLGYRVVSLNYSTETFFCCTIKS